MSRIEQTQIAEAIGVVELVILQQGQPALDQWKIFLWKSYIEYSTFLILKQSSFPFVQFVDIFDQLFTIMID